MSNFEFWTELDNIFEAVLAYQKKNIEFNKAFISPWVRLGHVFPREDSNQKTVQAILHAAELDPENAQNWADLGEAFYKMGSLEEAADAYAKLVELDPTAALPKSNLALTLATQGKYQEAILLYKESLEKCTDVRDKAVVWNRLGNVYRKLGDFENAVAAFLRADELDTKALIYQDPVIETPEPDSIEESLPGIPDLVADLAAPAPKSGEKENTTRNEEPQDIQSPSTNSPFDLVEPLDFAVMASDSEEFIFLEKDMGTTTQEPANTGSEPHAIKTTSTQNMPGEGIRHPDTPGANRNEFPPRNSGSDPKDTEEVTPDSLGWNDSTDLADLMAETEIFPEKIDSSRTGLSPVNIVEQSENIEPVASQPPDSRIAAEEYLKDMVVPNGMTGDEPIRQTPSSEPVAETQGSDSAKIEFDTQNANVWNELGNVYFGSGTYNDAIVAYRQAIELDPQFAWAYSNLALAYVQKERFDEAILLYKRSIELFKNAKDKAISWNRLGNLYRRQQDYDSAIEAYQTADELDPENVSLWLRSRFTLLGNILKEEPAYIS